MSDLAFPDPESLRDVATYVGRARSLDPDGAIRLQADGTSLAAYVGVLPGHGLMASGSVVGLRVLRLAEPAWLDVSVPLAAVADRLARPGRMPHLAVPPMTVTAPWAAMTPPRGGWERVGALREQQLTGIARRGIEAIARGAGSPAGGPAVTRLRERVWSEPTDTVPPVPAGAAFAVHALGFAAPGEEVTVLSHGRWIRLSSITGHVLLR